MKAAHDSGRLALAQSSIQTSIGRDDEPCNAGVIAPVIIILATLVLRQHRLHKISLAIFLAEADKTT